MEAVRSSMIGYELQDPTASRRRVLRLLRRLYRPLEKAENELLRMRNFSTITEQLAFFALADRLFLNQQQQNNKLTCVYTLMFYNVLAYCFNYARELASNDDWSPFVTLTPSTRIRHLAMSATRIVLEWTKAVTFLITVAFTLVVFCYEQTLHNYKPSFIYIATTWTYYAATEKVFADMFPSLLARLQLDHLDSLEHHYGPVVLRSFTITLSALFVLLLLPLAPWRFLIMSFYLNVFLRAKELTRNQWPVLENERRILIRYRKATIEEIRQLEDDDVCAVCLSPMRRARVTPCQHLFHDSCLRQCLKISDDCPLCKRRFVFA